MEIITITCQRDMYDMFLQAHTIDLFLEKPCVHWVVIEDGSYDYDTWLNFLSPYYTRHKLNLLWLERPNMNFDSEFIGYMPNSHIGVGGLGWRRQQILKLKVTADLVESERALVLDSKNFFVRPVDLDLWPVKHGNGMYMPLEHVMERPGLKTIKDWVIHLRDDHGLNIPDKFARILETPFVWQTDIVRDMCAKFSMEKLFLNPDVIPNSEFHMYFFFVDPADLDEEQDKICRVLMWNPTDTYEKHIIDSIDHCMSIDSPTHGLHRQTRFNMSLESIDIYKKWLTDKGLDAKLVDDYMTWCR